VLMKPATNTTSTSTLKLLSSEADLILEQARKYRAEMDALPANDPRRDVYEKFIRDLLDHSQKLSMVVTSTASST
jgi:hypothetical protein